MCMKCIFNFTRLLLRLIWKGIWKGNWEWLGCLFCSSHCFSPSVMSPLIFLLCKIQSEPPESFFPGTFLCLWTLSSPSRPLSGCYSFFYSAGMSAARPEQGYWSEPCPCIYKCHYSASDCKTFIANFTTWTCYKDTFLPVLGNLHALPATLSKQGLFNWDCQLFPRRRDDSTARHPWAASWDPPCQWMDLAQCWFLTRSFVFPPPDGHWQMATPFCCLII